MPRSPQPPAAHRVPLLPWIALGTVWFVWGSTFLGIRVAVSSIPPLLMAGSRYTIAGSIMAAAILLAQRRKLKALERGEIVSIVLSAILLLVIGNGSLSVGEVHLASGIAALIVATVPIWMLIVDAVIERRIQPLAVAGIVIGSGGIFALVGTPSTHVRLADAAVVLIGSFAWAVGSVLARRRATGRHNPLLPALEMLAGGVVLLLLAAASGETSSFRLSAVPMPSALGFLWLVVMGSMVAYTAYGYAVRTLPTNVVATYAYVNPIVAVLLGAVALKEPLTLGVSIGGAAIIVAVLCIMLANVKSKRREKPPAGAALSVQPATAKESL